MAAVSRLRRDLALPRQIVYRERADHVLPVDLDDPWSVDGWLDIAKGEMLVSEQFPVDRSAVRGPDGPYHHEIVVPFIARRDEAAAPVTRVHRRPPATPPDRVIPGGEVLYFRIAGDKSELLPILVELYADELSPMRSSGLLSSWFFLPYAKPRPHLRLRLFGEAAVLHGPVLQRIRERLDPLTRGRVLDAVTIDTYERETVRYGGPRGIQLCERVFSISSEFAVGFHAAIDVHEAELRPVLIAWVESLRAILAATALPLDQCRVVASHAAASFRHRPAATLDPVNQAAAVQPKHRAGEIYRKLSTALRDTDAGRTRFGEQRVRDLEETFRTLAADAASGTVHRPLEELVVDLLHVHSIRLLTAWHARPELEEIAYHLLSRVLATEAALTRS